MCNGARMALISLTKRAEKQSIASGVQYIELASAPGFMQNFMQANYIGRYRIIDGKTKEID